MPLSRIGTYLRTQWVRALVPNRDIPPDPVGPCPCPESGRTPGPTNITGRYLCIRGSRFSNRGADPRTILVRGYVPIRDIGTDPQTLQAVTYVPRGSASWSRWVCLLVPIRDIGCSHLKFVGLPLGPEGVKTPNFGQFVGLPLGPDLGHRLQSPEIRGSASWSRSALPTQVTVFTRTDFHTKITA